VRNLLLSITRLAFIVSLFFYTSLSHSHQQKRALTTLLFNANNGMLEVSHRFYIHDAEHAVKNLQNKNADLLNNPQTQQQFNDYVRNNFGLRINGKLIELQPVGFEVEGKFFWVYQEIPFLVDHLKTLEVSHRALQQLWPSQVNLINMEGLGKIYSIEMGKRDKWKNLYRKE